MSVEAARKTVQQFRLNGREATIARDILTELTSSDIANHAFPFGTWKRIGIAGCPITALRITYVGELCYELHLPVEYAVTF